MRTFVMNVASCFGFAFATGLPVAAANQPPDSPLARQEAQQLDQLPAVVPSGKAPIDHSGRKQKGKASYYSSKFVHKRMADGNHLNPQANVAASRNSAPRHHGNDHKSPKRQVFDGESGRSWPVRRWTRDGRDAEGGPGTGDDEARRGTGRGKTHCGAAAERRSQAGCRRGCSDAAGSSAGNEDNAIAGLREAMMVALSR